MIGGILRRFFRCAHHLAATAGVDREHLHIQSRGGGDGLGDRVWDVVKFQIEEHARAGRAHAAHDVRPGGNKSSLPILNAPTAGATSSASFNADSADGTSSATMMGFLLATADTDKHSFPKAHPRILTWPQFFPNL